MTFFERFKNIELESYSFWIGFIAATIFWWLLVRLRPYIAKAFAILMESAQSARQSLQTGAEQRLRSNTLKFAQNLHLASPLFSLDEILITPQLMAPPVMIVPGQEPALDYVSDNVIPYMPDFPELSGAFHGHTIPVHEAMNGGANLILTGNPGSGKTTALAYLATNLSRRDESLGDLRNHLPIFLHANDLSLPLDETQAILTPIIDTLEARSTALRKTRLPSVINNAFSNGQVVLLIDGLDEISSGPLENISKYLEQLQNDFPEIRVVVSTAPGFVDGLVELGMETIPMAAWNMQQQAIFIQQWSDLWKRYVGNSTGEEEKTSIDPILLNGWLLVDNAALTPLEFTLKVWSAYANDSRGPRGTDAIEAYLRRMSVGILQVRSALEHLATQMILTDRSTFTQNEAQTWTSGFDSGSLEGAGLAMVSDEPKEEAKARGIPIPRILSDLTNNGLLVSLPNNELSFIHPIIPSYLAGTSLAFTNQGDAILTQPDWSLKRTTIQYLASQSDLSDEAVLLLTDTEDPLHLEVLQAGNWLRNIPPDTTWHKPILQNLANMLQQEALPMGFRSRILVCLAATNDPGVASMFRHLLRSPKSSVRQLAALGCGFMRDTQAVDELSKMIIDPTPLGQAACLALVNIGTKQALDEAASIMLHGAEPLRRAVAEAFAFNKEDGHIFLREGSGMDDLLIRRVAIHGLRLVKEPWAVKILEEMQIEDGQWVVRNAAAQVVEEINQLDPYIPHPLEPLENLPWLIEFASEHGLGISAGDPAREMLLRVLRDGSPDQTYAALDRFRRNGDTRIFPMIYHLLYGEDLEIAEAAYNTLWHLSATGKEFPPPIQFGLGY
ncbi:NACHT domain-containing protein [Chloroflexota bacterium]